MHAFRELVHILWAESNVKTMKTWLAPESLNGRFVEVPQPPNPPTPPPQQKIGLALLGPKENMGKYVQCGVIFTYLAIN